MEAATGVLRQAGKAAIMLAVSAAITFTTFAHAADTAKSASDKSTQKSKTGGGPAGEKYDTKLPIEISADNLEVLQHDNKAIFKGNVIAVQGKLRLQSDTMIIHYKQKDQQPGAAGKPAPVPGGTPLPATDPTAPANQATGTSAAKQSMTASADQGEMGAITLIEVEGNVFMATPEESAKGDKGDYHVPEKMLHLTGDNVILTREKNILRGTELFYNLETGRSVLTNNTKGGPNAGRVHSVFVPNQQSKPADKNAKPAAGTAQPATPAIPAPVPGGQ